MGLRTFFSQRPVGALASACGLRGVRARVRVRLEVASCAFLKSSRNVFS